MTDPTLERAKSGDGNAFELLVGPYRRELHVHCYRLLGSTQDAEDVLQETLLAAWNALDSFDGRALRAWLYRIATNRCRNFLRDASRRPKVVAMPEQHPAANADSPWWLEPYPDLAEADIVTGPDARYDARESIALSFVAGLQRLPSQQRSALVLRDVLGFSAAEVADMLGSSVAAVNSALARARAAVPPRDPSSVSLPRSRTEAEVVDRFVDALEGGDIPALVALLTDDATLTMPPEPLEFHGRAAIAAFYQDRKVFAEPMKLVATTANCTPAFGYYLPDPHTALYRAAGVLVIELSGAQVSRITRITRFGAPALLARFGLPRTLPRST